MEKESIMSNELINKESGLPAIPQQAEKIYNVDNIQNFHHTSQFFMMGGLPGMPGAAPTPITYSHDYYNLIVYGQEPLLTDCHITLEKDRCLVELKHITEELRDRFSPLTTEIIEELKGFLCILACENKYYGWTDEDHYAAVAQLTDIKNRSNGIELYLHPLFAVSQARISERVFELGIAGRYKRYNELNHSHWTVKEIDLMEVLNDAGLNPFKR
jgi:hypothetical protein